MEKKGIDISQHQGNIDFEKLKGNIDFAMIRTSYGSFYKDNKYIQNVKGLDSIGIPYGFYHFSYATSVDMAEKEALGFADLIKEYKPLYPVVIDIESSSKTSDLRSDTLIDIADTFCKILEDKGYYVMIYANLDYLNNKLNSSKLDKYDKWLAEWKNKPTYSKKFGMWQYSSKGKIPGINTDVDLDISYYDYPKIIKEKNLNNINNKVEYKEEKNYNINYVVKKGDTLIEISKKYKIDYNEIAKINNISDVNKIYVGQVLKINSNLDNLNPKTYIVKKDDSLIKIAEKFNINWKDLYNKNKDIIGNDPNKLFPGQILTI